ncbi:MAG TPA: tRNA (N6-isopentenyl adenosine(37)-C2)-methylthiotransferase MiaB, partial [Clostridia bacterium]|nr:tRNA (N6-isopentenyl adenosine(37)-C2)-methylthiotransferase MiaB [Clostridia bacterium]
HNLHHLPNLLLQAMDSRHTVLEILDEEGRVVEDVPIKRTPGVSAWVTVMYGCNNYCSYCIVPYVRGRERSRLSPDILDEITGLAKDGYKEITLLGQNVNSYGKDFNSDYRFSDLLRDINKIGGVERIRFMTSHPKDLSLDLIDTMAECEKVCEHIHLPIQSGSNRILKEMNRRYTREDYIDLVHTIRERIPGISITTDIIVGFPGETDEDFQDTLEIMDRIKYDSAYTFLYSKRTGTPAAKMEGQIDIGLKKKRLHALMELQNNLSGENNKSSLNSVVEVLVEGLSKSADNIYSGRTRNNKLVNFSADRNVIGELVKVKINNPRTWTLEGIMI